MFIIYVPGNSVWHDSCRMTLSLSLFLAIPRERVWWSESSKMMMIMIMSTFMLDECAGGCKGRLLIDIFDHTDCTNMMYCLQCHHFLGSFAALSSVPPWWFVSAPGLQLPYAMCVASKLGHLLCFPIGAPFNISSGWNTTYRPKYIQTLGKIQWLWTLFAT